MLVVLAREPGSMTAALPLATLTVSASWTVSLQPGSSLSARSVIRIPRTAWCCCQVIVVVPAPVALVASVAVLLVGQFREFIARLFQSQLTGDATIATGGGPIESLYRIVSQTSITLELDPTPAVQAMKLVDMVLLAPMRVAAGIFPSLSTLGTGDFVAGGFYIPGDLLAAHAAETLAYVAAFCIAGAFCLRAREVAS